MRKSIKSSSKAQDTEKEKHQQLTTREGDALLTAGEGDALRSYLSGLDKETAPTINFSEDGSEISICHPDQKMGFLLLTAAFGATNRDFAMDIILELMEASREGSQFNCTKFNSLLAMVISLKPRNESDGAFSAPHGRRFPRAHEDRAANGRRPEYDAAGERAAYVFQAESYLPRTTGGI